MLRCSDFLSNGKVAWNSTFLSSWWWDAVEFVRGQCSAPCGNGLILKNKGMLCACVHGATVGSGLLHCHDCHCTNACVDNLAYLEDSIGPFRAS